MRMVRNGVVVDFGYVNGIPATISFNGNTFYYITNGQGDITGITDTQGNVLITYYYDAWGTAYCTYNTATSPYAQSLYDLNPLLYRGYVFDREAGMYYLQSRYYIPSIGRFLNADGLVSTGQGILGNNMFAYCDNNPVNRTDPTGEFWITALVVTAVVVVCGAGLSGCSKQSDETVGAAPDYYQIGESDGDRSVNPNCYAYALGYYNRSYDPGDFSTHYSAWTIEAVGAAVESDLNALGRECRRIDSYNSPIDDDEYRIALRISPVYYTYTISGKTGLLWDYHFMVQTSTGKWAEKHGPGGATVYHDSGNPSTISWDANGITGFYSSEIFYYAITN